jgi:hypothetical protein
MVFQAVKKSIQEPCKSAIRLTIPALEKGGYPVSVDP